MDLVEEITRLPADWHGAGTFNNKTLRAIAERCSGPYESLPKPARAARRCFSQVSRHHWVFAQDDTGNGDSLDRVRASPLLKPGVVSFIVGATQQTLPVYDMPPALDLVLIDGPHGFPFPELEYYYFYPRLRTSGALILDDIQIGSIHAMFRILKADQMWNLDAVVDDRIFHSNRCTHRGPHG